ncbi:hypothetical protein IE4872_CH00497 [Rhizobium gallicum]|uniref:Uncharacterized protein n=1 Tax=Rhizobium gallicum TaxID=56730 RepID=A0A1L5NE40_9HYPH|nr:hypothetical protein [Rhizobium gallicum]APO66162.1 hypothetical protein IE4872_CH00497 [Rhizobium gallicum]
MFNLLGNGEWWETPPFTSTIDRFKEYSGVEAEAIDLARPETLRRRLFVDSIYIAATIT